MFEAIEAKLQWLESMLSDLGGMLEEPYRIDLDKARAVLAATRRAPMPPDEAAKAFVELCDRMKWGGQFLLAVNAIDVCRHFMANDPQNAPQIVDQLCTATRLHEKCERDVHLGALLPDAFDEVHRENRSKQASRAATARHADDPRQREKQFVFDCWKDWRSNPERYRSKAKFARDMIEKCKHLESTKNIEDWCRVWEKSEPC